MPASSTTLTDSSSGSTLPVDRESLLARAGEQRSAIYAVVRELIDALDDVASWEMLYAPPDEGDVLARSVRSFLELVEGVPERIQELVEELRVGGMEAQSLEDVDFFFGGIHGMVTSDLKRLRTKLEELEAEGESSGAQRAYLCEIAADIKGKYASAVMGAASSLIAEGLWNSVEIEPLLFPEKAAEFARNEALVEAIDEVLSMIERLPGSLSFTDLLDGWRARQRLDRYVLVDLDRLKSELGMLLKPSNRRALYSGDYHQILRRESLLSARLNELESLHRSTWSEAATTLSEGTGERLAQLVLEVAAIIDVKILEGLIGEHRCRDLRAVVTTERARGGRSEMRRSLPGGLGQLVPLLAEDDLVTYFGTLRGAVLKRLSLRAGSDAETEAMAEPRVDESPPEPRAEDDAGEEMTRPPAADETTTSGELPEESARPSTSGAIAALTAARDYLTALRSTTNPSWKGFLMVERMLSRHGRIPPRMFGLAAPFVDELLRKLLPLLEQVARLDDFPQSTVEKLRRGCQELQESDVSPTTLEGRIPKALRTVSEGLEESVAKLTELVVNRSVF